MKPICERVCTPRCAGKLSRKTVNPNAAAAWCQLARFRLKMPGKMIAPIANQKLKPASQAQEFAGSQLETTSYQANSGDSNCAVLRANRKFVLAALLKAAPKNRLRQPHQKSLPRARQSLRHRLLCHSR